MGPEGSLLKKSIEPDKNKIKKRRLLKSGIGKVAPLHDPETISGIAALAAAKKKAG